MTNDTPLVSRMGLRDGANTMVYDALFASRMGLRDAENRVASINSSAATYSYDGNNLRVKKVNGSTTTAYIFSGLPAVAGSKVIAEYDNGAAPSSPSREYLYAGGTLIATYSGGNTYYHHQDHLSVRITTDSSGNIAGQQGHFPFDESWYASNTTTKYQFTTYERDSESGNDYAMARYHVNRLARFSSVDPVDGDPSYPQTWNHYAYAGNDPTNMVDPSGQDDVFAIPDGDLIDHWPCTFDAAFGQFACGDFCAKGTQGCSEAGGGGGFSFGIDFGLNGFDDGSGETGGIPTGLLIPPITLQGLLFPTDPNCEFGPCYPAPSGFFWNPQSSKTESFYRQVGPCLKAELTQNTKKLGNDLKKLVKGSIIAGAATTVALTFAQPELAPAAPGLFGGTTLSTITSLGAARLGYYIIQNAASTIGCTYFTAKNVITGR